jgi:hypothetical protein
MLCTATLSSEGGLSPPARHSCQATAVWDVAYAESRREVTATEQHLHGLLEQAPAMAAAVMLTLHWDLRVDRRAAPHAYDEPELAATTTPASA